MNKHFHNQPFDEATRLKLEIFKRYTREWVSVFMTESPSLKNVTAVNIFDFFAGPGGDSFGNDGSPIIILKELKAYCESRAGLKAQRPITLYFNDIDEDKITQLQKTVSETACQRGCCEIIFSVQDFSEALEHYFPLIKNLHHANLIILDQFGIKDVTPEIVELLSKCNRTDIIFFIPSSYIKRFQNHPAFKSKFDLADKNLDYNTIHRHICDYFKEKLNNQKYHLAPFSIKTGKSIHGLIFGSGNLYGLEKFLKVCWDLDPQTGQANYNIDNDFARDGQLCLFNMNTFRKVDQFEQDLKEYIQRETPDNLQIYSYILEKGFPPTEAKKIFDKMLADDWLKIIPGPSEKKTIKGAYYLNHNETTARIRFAKKGGSS